MSSFTFTWNEVDVKTQAVTNSEISIGNVRRPARESVTRHKVEIPGRVGSWDFGGGVKRDYIISVDVIITGDSSSEVFQSIEAVGTFLDGKEELIFSDSDTVHYGQVFAETTPVFDDESGVVARFTIDFECDAGYTPAE